MPCGKPLPYDNTVCADYSVFGKCFFERVAVTNEQSAKIFWLNADWFASQGIDLRVAANWKRVERRLLASFAIRTKASTDLGDKFAKADRYGGTGGTAHGGSGRCVYRGRFNVKGVGRTPLVPSGIFSHTNGQYLLIEAIRGAVYSELAHYESLAGAVRTVAIIDLPPFHLPPEERRCLIVRPNFIRPAHFERSLLFGTAGFEGSDQFKDNVRVHTVRHKLSEWGVKWLDVALNLAKQIGSLDAMRMSQGRFTSSNMAIDGKVADFETFRIFDSWYYTKHIDRDAYIFGKELDLLKRSAERWSQTMGRHGSDNLPKSIDRAHQEGFFETVRFTLPSTGSSGDSPTNRFLAFLYSVFRSHARRQVEDPYAWIIDPKTISDDFRARMVPLASSFGFNENEAIVVAARLNAWRISRSAITLGEINSIAADLVSYSTGNIDAVSEKLEDLVTGNRRIFRFEDDGLAPILLVRHRGARLLYALNIVSRQTYEIQWQLEGLGTASLPRIKHCSVDDVLKLARKLDSNASDPAGVLYNGWLLDCTNRSPSPVSLQSAS